MRRVHYCIGVRYWYRTAAVTESTKQKLPPEHAAIIAMVAACFVHFWICHSIATEIILDVDPTNLIYGMREFNLAHFAPHPPGYLVYVWLLRVLHVVMGGEPLAAVQVLAQLFSAATIPLVFWAIRLLRPKDVTAQLVGIALATLHPFLIFHAVDAQTHTSEAFAAALLLVVLLKYRQRPSVALAMAAGATLALGSAFRPSFVVAGIGPIVWAIGFRRFVHLGAAGLASVAGAVAWLVPTLSASGGYERWREINNTLITQVFVRTASPFSDEAVPAFVFYNLRNTAFWLALVALPIVVAVVATRRAESNADDALAQARSLALWSGVPAVIFYLSMFCSEPGYLLGFVPPIIVATALLVGAVRSQTRRRLAIALVVASQTSILAFPAGGIEIAKVPSLPEIAAREVLYRHVLGKIRELVPAGAKILYVTDYPDIVLSRQLPVQHPDLHSMIYMSEHWPGFEHTAVSFATQEDWLPIPGPVMLMAGPPTTVDVGYTYDYVVVSPIASNDLRKEMSTYTECPLGDVTQVQEVLALPATECFQSRTIVAHGQGVRFKLPGDP